ncbi:hypothetical protein FISHEDRAFT_48195 [Fistulina hepatica ATCC 64428]|uniref:Transmembrane protein n=1 Tax=Fistulina hepatica ATCC 64428 TaxID=1128425 RepID=A0A0D7A582_9AGAR|nr:hypothetical protein FISHEDRAFT_48195 [Fistulina hepatica ATCC 64428]
MTYTGPRLHRLPQRLDYTLIPAPLDLSLSTVTEKSALPAIIVTPSTPTSSHDFAIAFLAPPPKPTLCERLAQQYKVFNFKVRITLIALLMFAILVCHLMVHGFATRRPRLEFAMQTGPQDTTMKRPFNWWNLHLPWQDFDFEDDKRDFVVEEAHSDNAEEPYLEPGTDGVLLQDTPVSEQWPSPSLTLILE